MSFDVMAMNNYGFGGYANPAYTGNPLLTPYNVSKYDENAPWWIRSMYKDPVELARYNANVNNVRNEVMLDNEYNLKKLRREKEYEDQEAARLDDIKRNRQTNLVRSEANKLQTVLHSGKMELIKGAWDKYLAELKEMPEIKAEAGENGELSNKQLAAAAFRYYSLFNVDADGKPANFAIDAAGLPTSLTQGLWNGLTFGLYENENHSSIMEYTNGTPQSRADRVKQGLGVATGTALAYGATVGTGMFVLDGIRNSSLVSKLEAIEAAAKNLAAIDALDDISGMKNLVKSLKVEMANLDNAIANNTSTAQIEKNIKELNDKIAEKLNSAIKFATKADIAAKNALDKAIAEETKATNLKNAKEEAFQKIEKEVANIEEKLAKELPADKKEKLLNELDAAQKKLGTAKDALSAAESDLANKTVLKEAAEVKATKATEKLASVTEKANGALNAQAKISIINKKAVSAQKSLCRSFGSLGDDAARAIKGGAGVSESLSTLKSARKFKIGGKWGAIFGAIAGLGVGIYQACTKEA